MSHNAQEIAQLRARLAILEAADTREAAERSRANQNRPPGIPATWNQILFEDTATGNFAVVGWLDPNYTVSVLRKVTP